MKVYDKSLHLTMMLGEDGKHDNDLFHFNNPEDVAVDTRGQIYVADIWNNRVQVFNSSGAFLTSIGGNWGDNTGDMRHASSVDVDAQGNVYISDFVNGRILVYAPGVPGWRQANINGFGSRQDLQAVLGVFQGQLYAATQNWVNGTMLYRTADGQNWTAVTTRGQGLNADTPAVITMTTFGDHFYLGTGWSGHAGGVWRSADGSSWSQAVENGFGSPDIAGTTDMLFVHQNQLYAAFSRGETQGVSLYRSATGETGSWSPVFSNGNGDPDNILIDSVVLFHDRLYAAGKNKTSGAFVWQSSADGSTWTPVTTPGMGTPKQNEGTTMAVFQDVLYLGTYNSNADLITPGQIWRSTNGTDWNVAISDGFGDAKNTGVATLYPYGDALYALTNNDETGAEMWKTTNGTDWVQDAADGFGSSNTTWSVRGNAITTFQNALYLGVGNTGSGAQIWQRWEIFNTYLPAVRR